MRVLLKGRRGGAEVWRWVISHLGRAQDFLVGKENCTVKTGHGREENLDTDNTDGVETKICWTGKQFPSSQCGHEGCELVSLQTFYLKQLMQLLQIFSSDRELSVLVYFNSLIKHT